MHHQAVVLFSMMRSGSTEFAQELAHEMNYTFLNEAFNFLPKNMSHVKSNPSKYIRQLTSKENVVLKLFNRHTTTISKIDACNVVLERKNIDNQWCSLINAKKFQDWTSGKRRNCSIPSPKYFTESHNNWYKYIFKTLNNYLYITFDDVVYNRNETILRSKAYCLSKLLLHK